MTAYKRTTKAGDRWRYDFERAGVRHTSEAIYATEAKALKAEREHKAELKRGGVANNSELPGRVSAKNSVTLAMACDLYWRDVARHHRSARDIQNRLAIVQRVMVEARRIESARDDVTEIRFGLVMAARELRRAETGRFGKPLSGATVNRDIIDTMRPALNHVARVKELALPKIDWGKLRLKERDELQCEFNEAEIERWGQELASDTERLFLACALTYGPRLGELFFPPSAVKLDAPGGAELELGRYIGRAGVRRESRKDDSLHVLPLHPFDAEALAPLVARAIDLGAETIWLKADGAPLTYYAMAGRVRRAAKRAGIVQERLVHGMRHHAATAITRANDGALTPAQTLLGHKKITTTQRYAHVSKGDLSRALGRVSRAGISAKNEAENPAPAPPAQKPLTR